MTFGSRLRKARKLKGYTQKSLAQIINAKHNSISNWENDQNIPDTATIESLCRVLSVTPNYLLMGDNLSVDAPQGIGDKEFSVLERYRRLDAHAQGAVEALLDYYCAGCARPSAKDDEEQADTVIPFETITGLISTQSVAAGSGTFLDSDNFDVITVRKNALTGKTAFYVPVAGDSMEPKFHDGDILMIEKTTVQYGEIGVFTLDNQGYVKIRGKRELISLNPEYAPIPMNEDIICNGKVIGVLDQSCIIK